MFALIACLNLWICSPEPLLTGIRIEHCYALAQTMRVEGVSFKCERVT
jgi:hypothetical protein